MDTGLYTTVHDCVPAVCYRSQLLQCRTYSYEYEETPRAERRIHESGTKRTSLDICSQHHNKITR